MTDNTGRTLQLIAPWIVMICRQASGKALIVDRGTARSLGNE